jgi:peptidoglycan/LPS O-acetylase OafA/YrhL
MGFYRYLLAALVAASHCQIFFWDFNQGVVAVISFMIISGYVMTLLLERNYAELREAPRFYLDRAARLLPQFFLYSLLMIALISFTPMGDVVFRDLAPARCTSGLLLLNLSLFGNNFYYIFGDCMLIPATWSLGLEACFYLAAPFVIIGLSRPWRHLVIAGSVAVYLCAYAGVLNPDMYGYRLLPGTLFIFMVGAAMARPGLCHPRLPLLVFAGAVLLLGLLLLDATIYARPLVKEVLLGIVLGIPAVAVLRRLVFGAADAWLGNISYGLFLNHVPCRWVAEASLGITSWSGPEFLALMLVSSALAWVSYHLVEQPALRWRRRLRQGAARLASVQ